MINRIRQQQPQQNKFVDKYPMPKDMITIPVVIFDEGDHGVFYTTAFGFKTRIYWGVKGLIEPKEDENGQLTITYNAATSYLKAADNGYTALYINK